MASNQSNGHPNRPHDLRNNEEFKEKIRELTTSLGYKQAHNDHLVGPVTEFCNSKLRELRGSATTTRLRSEQTTTGFLLEVIGELECDYATTAFYRSEAETEAKKAKDDADSTSDNYLAAIDRNIALKNQFETLSREHQLATRKVAELEAIVKDYQNKEAAANFIIYKNEFAQMKQDMEKLKRENEEMKQFKITQERTNGEVQNMCEQIYHHIAQNHNEEAAFYAQQNNSAPSTGRGPVGQQNVRFQ